LESQNYQKKMIPTKKPIGNRCADEELSLAAPPPSMEDILEAFAEEEKEEISDLVAAPPTEFVAESAEAQVASVTRAFESVDDVAIWATPSETTAEDQELLALKRAAYTGRNINRGYLGGSDNYFTDSQQEATVVAITEATDHPLELPAGAVLAELIGQDFSSMTSVHHALVETTSYGVDPLQQPIDAHATSGEATTTEATVIDSEPLDRLGDKCIGEEAAWKVREAQVLSEEIGADNSFLSDRKRSAEENGFFPTSSVHEVDDRIPGTTYVDLTAATHEFAVADREAEVVEIQEEAHPNEFENDAEATLVGTVASLSLSGLGKSDRRLNGLETAAIGLVAPLRLSERNMHLSEDCPDFDDTAKVLSEEVGVANSFCSDRKRSAEENGIVPTASLLQLDAGIPGATYADLTAATHEFAVADGDAEVVEIQEEVHPDEFEDDAEATLVGTVASLSLRSFGKSDRCFTGFETAPIAPGAPVHLSERNLHLSEDRSDVNDTTTPPNAGGADREAEIVAIQEDVHPDEYVNGSGADAEFVARYYEYCDVYSSEGRATTTENPVEGFAIAQNTYTGGREEDVAGILSAADAEHVASGTAYAVATPTTRLHRVEASIVEEASVFLEHDDVASSASTAWADAYVCPLVEKPVPSLQTGGAAAFPSTEDEDSRSQTTHPMAQMATTPVSSTHRSHMPSSWEADQFGDGRPAWLIDTPPAKPFASTNAEVSNLSASSTGERSCATASSHRQIQLVSHSINRRFP
jgi:hypothetical protein